MPAGFHPDPDLCGVGSDVLCWIESVGEGDPHPYGMATSGYQVGALDTGDRENGLMSAGLGGDDLSNNSEWLGSDTSGLSAGKANDYGLGDLMEDTPGSGDFSSAPGDSSLDYSMFSR